MKIEYTRCDSCSFIFDKEEKFCPKCNTESIVYESIADEYLNSPKVCNINS